jgi:uncharacterized protein involved in response to NO
MHFLWPDYKIHFMYMLKAEPPSGLPLLRLAFRPFYLGAAAISVAWMALWWLLLGGHAALPNAMPPVLWHAHEMLFGFVAAVVVGFLLTAGKLWTGLQTPRGAPLAALWLLWLAGRIASVAAAPPLFAAIDTLFLLLAAAIFATLILRAHNLRNLKVVAVLGLLAIANGMFHLGALGLSWADPLQALHGGLGLVVMLIAIIAGRVIPAFTQSATPGLRLAEPRWLSPVAVACTALGLALWTCGMAARAGAAVLAAAALLQALRLAHWAPMAGRGRPILWVLHLSYAWLPLGLGLLAASQAGWIGESAGIHALAVGCVGGLVIGMMTRTARGHTGRELKVSRAEVAAYGLVMAAALARVAVPWLPPPVQAAALLGAAAAWTLAFVLYLWRFAPWLLSTRADGRDG